MSSTLLHRPMVIVLGALLTACGGNTEAAVDDAPAASGNVPPIHLDQTAETWLNGANVERSSYQQALAGCEAAGMPTRALSPEDVARLGTTRYEVWISSDEEVFRTRQWRLAADGAAPSCQFRLEVTGMQEVQNASSIVQVDLATGERSESSSDAQALTRYAAEPGESEAAPGWRGAGKRTVAGQPCNDWSEDGGKVRQCVWSAGGDWGFTPGAMNDHRPSRDLIVLEREPIDGNGVRLTTQRMTVGKPFDRRALEAPRADSIGQ